MSSTSRIGGTLLAVSLVLSPAAAAAGADDPRIGTFVEGERPIYLEIDRLVAGEEYRIELRNVPEGSTKPVLFFSPDFYPMDMNFAKIPGVMGPDLLKGDFMILGDKVSEGTVDEKLAGQRLFLQAYVGTPTGKRLSNMVTVTVRAEDFDAYGDGGTRFPLDLITQEVLPDGRPAFDRVDQHVRVGVPIPEGKVWESHGVPQLTVRGQTPAAQFTTLAQWPDGSVKWALAEYQADVNAGDFDRSYSVDHGGGNFGGDDLCTVSEQRFTVDTGGVRFILDGTTANLFESMEVGGTAILDPTVPNRFHFVDQDDHEWTYHPMQATLRCNGPVRCEIQVDGKLTHSSSNGDQDRIYLRCYVEAFRGVSCIRVRTSLRNTSASYPWDLQFRGLSWSGRLRKTGTFDVRLPQVSTNGTSWGMHSGTLDESSESASIVEGFVKHTNDEITDDHNSTLYTPFLERIDKDRFVIEGVRSGIAGKWFTGDSGSDWYSDKTEYADPFFLEVNERDSGQGMVIAVQQAAATWPVGLHANAAGDVEVELFPRKSSDDNHHYPLTYATCETRSFLLFPEVAPSLDPHKVVASCDYPAVARGELWVYNQSKVWPWRLVSPEESRQFAEHAGLRTPYDKNADPTRTLFRYAGGTGGENNNWRASQAFYLFLRTGHGGGWFRGTAEALYKADKMAVTLDDATLDEYQSPLNEGTATKHGKFWDGSKHTFLQAVPDVGFACGDFSVLDGAPHLAATLMSDRFTSSQPYGNFVPGTYGAVTTSALALLQAEENQELEDHCTKILHQWANLVFQEENDLGVDASIKGWQAPVGTPIDTALNPDGYFVTKAAGKRSDWDEIGYTNQVWVDCRINSLAFWMWTHHLEQTSPGDPLIEDLRWRAQDIYHFARRAAPDDYSSDTGDEYVHDVFPGDAGDPAPDKYLGPGRDAAKISQTGYALQSWILFYLDQTDSESAYSYGVELANSMSEDTYIAKQSDPVFNEFVYRYLRHHGLIDL